jgi:hypothetical protein
MNLNAVALNFKGTGMQAREIKLKLGVLFQNRVGIEFKDHDRLAICCFQSQEAAEVAYNTEVKVVIKGKKFLVPKYRTLDARLGQYVARIFNFPFGPTEQIRQTIIANPAFARGKVVDVLFHTDDDGLWFVNKATVLLEADPATMEDFPSEIELFDVKCPVVLRGENPPCRYCKSMGHRIENCDILSRRVCTKCTKTGHYAERCPAPKRMRTTPKDAEPASETEFKLSKNKGKHGPGNVTIEMVKTSSTFDALATLAENNGAEETHWPILHSGPIKRTITAIEKRGTNARNSKVSNKAPVASISESAASRLPDEARTPFNCSNPDANAPCDGVQEYPASSDASMSMDESAGSEDESSVHRVESARSDQPNAEFTMPITKAMDVDEQASPQTANQDVLLLDSCFTSIDKYARFWESGRRKFAELPDYSLTDYLADISRTAGDYKVGKVHRTRCTNMLRSLAVQFAERDVPFPLALEKYRPATQGRLEMDVEPGSVALLAAPSSSL